MRQPPLRRRGAAFWSKCEAGRERSDAFTSVVRGLASVHNATMHISTTLIGRDGELGAIREFLERVQHGPSALVLSGEPGIGKTVLWEAGVEQAGPPFGRVLSHRSAEAEALLSFAGLSELVTPVLEDVAAFLVPMRRQALEVALLLAEPGEEPADARAIGLAFLDVLQLLAQQTPLVVAVDDLQWLDSSSATVLEMALRRLRHERVGFLATVREEPDVAPPFDLDRLLSGHGLTQVSLRPVSLSALHRLLRERLGLDLARPELARVHEASGGNPFFALELGRELLRTSERPEPGMPLPVPGSLGALLGGRLARLPDETSDVLLYAAALARPSIDVVAAAHGNQEAAFHALEVAVREGVVSLDGARIRFFHPLLAAISYEKAPLWQRRPVHRALADVVTDVEERARHLALAADGPDIAVASDLVSAAEQAAVRGAPAAAAELSEFAAELTPAADVEDARRRRLRAAQLHAVAGNPERAGVLFEQLLAQAPPGVERADVLFGLATVRPADPLTCARLLEEALAEAADDDERSARILGYRALIAFTSVGPGGSLPDARAALERAERVGDPTLLAVAIARVGQVETYTTEITPSLLEQGVVIEERLDRTLDFFSSPSAMLALRRLVRDELDEARPVFERAAANAAGRGAEQERAWVLFYLMWLEWLAGRWQLASEHLSQAIEVARQSQDEFLWPQVLNQQAFLEAYLGRVEQARKNAEEVLAIFEEAATDIHAIVCLSTLGHLELALGNLAAADRYLRELPGRLLSFGWKEPSHPLWSDTIETLVALGELEQAGAYLAQYEDLARHFSRCSRACSARCRGLLAAAEGDLGAAFEAFERSLSELAGLSYPFERGRTLLCLGSARRQAKQKRLAREALEQALAIFEDLGARLWAEKARSELKRISGRRPSEELTETEERVARLAAKEIAAALFMSVHTVEAHLTHVYRKLGIRSRGQLANRLPKPAGEASNQPEPTAKQ